MAENYSFRSSLNGFNRNDVIEFINSILTDKSSDNDEIAELKNQIAESDKIIAGLKNELENSRSAADIKASETEIAKVYEARLGAAMLDAKRFSEILVKEANDKASDLFSEALKSADNTSLNAEDIINKIKTLKDELDKSFDSLIDSLSSIRTMIDSFKDDVKATGGMFNFSTDFLPINNSNDEIRDNLNKKLNNASSDKNEKHEAVKSENSIENKKDAEENTVKSDKSSSSADDDTSDFEIRVVL